jgi:hypothetical protein
MVSPNRVARPIVTVTKPKGFIILDFPDGSSLQGRYELAKTGYELYLTENNSPLSNKGAYQILCAAIHKSLHTVR